MKLFSLFASRRPPAPVPAVADGHTRQKCPQCGSTDVAWKTKARCWECASCETRFDSPQADPATTGGRTVAARANGAKAIFFSYGHDANLPLVNAFKADLERRGHAVWIDYKQIGTWQDWRGRITQGVHESDLAVAFLSRHSTRDPGVCRNEVAIALNRFGTVYPVLLEPVQEVSPPVTISHLQWQDLSQWREIREGRVPGKDWARWYEEKLLQLVTLVEGAAGEFTGDIQALREVLRPVAFSSDIARHVPDFVGRDWVFEAYEQWLAQRSGSRLLWINGGPGLGKSAIAANLVHNHQSAIVGAWFCQVHSLERRDVRVALCSLAFQLACRWDDYRSKLRFQLGLAADATAEDWRRRREALLEKNEADLFHTLLAEPLSGLIWREQRLVVVIDALDEAVDEHGRNPLVDLLVTRLATLPAWLAFVVTSRPDPDVVAKLQGFAPFEFDPLEGRNQQDLRAYLGAALDRRHEFAALPARERARIEQSLLENSEGMILYLRQVVQGLDEGSITLATLGDVPRGLHGLYRIAFEHQFGGPDTVVYDAEVRPLLRLLAAAPGPLPEGLAAAALGWDMETFVRARNRLGSYAVDSPQGLRLFHKTLHEWLGDKRSAPFLIDAKVGGAALGDYLWACCMEAATADGAWQEQVREWLPALLQFTEHWNDVGDLQRLGNYFRGQRRLASAYAMLQRRLEVAEKEHGADSAEVVAALLDLADVHAQDWERAEPLCRRALQVQLRTLGPEHPAVAPTMERLARHCHRRGPEREDLFRRAIAIRRATNTLQAFSAASAMVELGHVMLDRGEFDGAEQLYIEAHGIYRNVEPGQAWVAEDGLADVRNARATLDERAVLERKLASLEADAQSDASELEAVVARLARLERRRDPATGEALYRRLLDLRQDLFGAGHPGCAEALLGVAHCTDDSALTDRCQELAIEIMVADPHVDQRELAFLLNTQGVARMRDGQFDLAERHLRRLLALQRERADSSGCILAFRLLGALHERRGDKRAAVEMHGSAYQAAKAAYAEEDALGKTRPDGLVGVLMVADQLIETAADLAASLAGVDEPGQAAELYREAIDLSDIHDGAVYVGGGERMAKLLRGYAAVLEAQGRVDEAGATRARADAIGHEARQVGRP
jgi:tetratricopeptide (TPR) repeat protein